ncbi:MAG: cupin domain-containing protein [Pseudomonadota bacterium]
MISNNRSSRALWRGLIVAGLVAGATSVASVAAFAGECPANKIVADGQGQKQVATEPVGVADTVLASIDLAEQKVALNDRLFRIRRLEIQPGGVVPWHDHADRPALIYILQGEITEYASNCAAPILHKAGEVSRDADLSHWWKNTGNNAVVLISADILHDKKEEHMM